MRCAVGRDHCGKPELGSFSVCLETMDWNAHKNFRLSSSRSTVQTIVQAFCKELVDLSSWGQSSAHHCGACSVIPKEFKVQPEDYADIRFTENEFAFDFFLLCK